MAEHDPVVRRDRAAGRSQSISASLAISGLLRSDHVRQRRLADRVLRGEPLGQRRLEMAAVGVVGGTRPFGRDHRRPQRRLRRAFPAERRAVVRLLQPLQDLPADADRRFLRSRCSSTSKQPLGVVVAILVAQLVAALRDQADAPPLAVADLEDVVDQPPATPGCPRAGRPGRTGSRPRPRPASSCRTVRKMPSSRSSGSKPVMTIGTLITSRRSARTRRIP